MLIALISFLAGLFLAPIVRPLFRPFFIELIKVAYSAVEEAKRATSKAKEELADAVATAEAERTAAEETKKHGHAETPPQNPHQQ